MPEKSVYIVIQLHCREDSHLGTVVRSSWTAALELVNYIREHGVGIVDGEDITSVCHWAPHFLGQFHMYEQEMTLKQAQELSGYFLLPDIFKYIHR